ncbi:MAG: FeoB-associated Cys-rich membrane protein [Treponemataceae bacterium]|nr:FeoB-associated Cys-rich membrane protein [Treponemataceae bacterium]
MIGTVVVSLVLVAVVFLIVRSMIKTKRSGKHVLSCGGNCSACGMCGSCPHHAASSKESR